MTYATQRHVASIADCWFYHVMDLPEVGTVSHFGSWDLRDRFDDYISRVDVRGKTFLDVGSASGFLTFEAEKRGAIVTSFDVELGGQVNIGATGNATEKQREVVMMQNGYWLAHRLLNSKAKVIYGDAANLASLAPPSDIVMLGQILVHMKDPISVLEQAARVARKMLIIAEGSFHNETPAALFYGATYPGTNTWWHLSDKIYEQCLGMWGFKIKSVTTGQYRCNHPAAQGMQEIWTYIAERV